MVKPTIYKAPDIIPPNIKLITEEWRLLSDMYYEYMIDDRKIEGKTNGKGFIVEKNFKFGGRLKVMPQQEDLGSGEVVDKVGDESESAFEYPENPGLLPVLDLRNLSDGGQGPLRRGDHRRSLIEHLQFMLNEIGYDLKLPDLEGEGIDGLFQDMTEDAIKDFQGSHKDWEGQQLQVDGLVGPRTADALNREFVGIWYPKYETPMQLTDGCRFIIIDEDFAAKEGLNIE